MSIIARDCRRSEECERRAVEECRGLLAVMSMKHRGEHLCGKREERDKPKGDGVQDEEGPRDVCDAAEHRVVVDPDRTDDEHAETVGPIRGPEVQELATNASVRVWWLDRED